MEADFWLARWREGRIGFHEGKPNDLLAAHIDALGPTGRVLVPLSGKTEDMAFLAARGHEVVGIELAGEAVRAFFAEHGLVPEVSRRGSFIVHSAAGITLLEGDVFGVTRADIGAITALYDRASIVALPTETRARYAGHLRTLLEPSTPGLVITFEYPEGAMEGPPFSVSEAELRTYFPKVTPLAQRPADGPRLREANMGALERLYKIRM